MCLQQSLLNWRTPKNQSMEWHHSRWSHWPSERHHVQDCKLGLSAQQKGRTQVRTRLALPQQRGSPEPRCRALTQQHTSVQQQQPLCYRKGTFLNSCTEDAGLLQMLKPELSTVVTLGKGQEGQRLGCAASRINSVWSSFTCFWFLHWCSNPES